MTRIGFLIPEFPGQTHAFFIRERAELKKAGIDAVLISTQKPVAGAGLAKHDWAEQAAAETTYLYPLGLTGLMFCLFELLISGPRAWGRCLAVLFGSSDMTMTQRLKMFGVVLVGANLKRFCRSQSLRHVHIHSCANSANVGLMARLLGGPTYSITLHGPMQDYSTNQARKWVNAAYAIVITQELYQEVHRLLEHIDLPPIFLAPMGVNIEDFKRSVPYSPVKPEETIKLVSCGRLNFVKAHDDLIRVVAKLKEKGLKVQLHICGATDSLSHVENYHEKLLSLCEELDVKEEVSFLGSVSENRVKEELESAHFFCLASLREPLGVATMEAMAMEMPVIVTRSPGVTEMVDNGVDGVLVEPSSPDQFVAAIEALVVDPDRALEIAESGRKKVVQKFHSGVSAGKIKEGFEKYAC